MTSSQDDYQCRLLLPKPVLPPPTFRTAGTQKLLASVVNEPPLRQKLRDLTTVFDITPQQPPNTRIIAVQGTSDEKTRFMSQFLTHYIQKELAVPVRVFSGLSPPTAPIADHEQHLHQVRNWITISDFITTAAPPCMQRAQGQTVIASTVPTTPLPPTVTHSADMSYVNIIPLSPLMITTSAAVEGPAEAAVWSERKWRGLLSHWRGAKRPNIIINIQECERGVEDGQILRIVEGDLKGLIVVTTVQREVDITAKQLRRIAFEVIEWLRDD